MAKRALLIGINKYQIPGADLYAADVAGSSFIDCDMSGADLSQAKLTGARLHGSDLADVVGGAALRDLEIDGTQIMPLAFAIFDGLGIRVTER